MIKAVTIAVMLSALNLLSDDLPTMWRGTNSYYTVLVVMNPPVNGVVEYAAGKVKFHGEKSSGHPARCWRGSNGWVTVDYGEGSGPEKIVQFRIIKKKKDILTCVTDNTDTILADAPAEEFKLYRQKNGRK